MSREPIEVPKHTAATLGDLADDVGRGLGRDVDRGEVVAFLVANQLRYIDDADISDFLNIE